MYRDFVHAIGLNRSLYRHARGCRMIVYHGVCLARPTRFNTLFITRKTFENHLRFYKKYFNTVSLADYYAGNFDPNRFNICLTFDDGFANNYHHVLPLLERWQIPATFFVTAISNTHYDILWNDLLAIARRYGPERFRWGDQWYTQNRTGRYTDAAGSPLDAQLRESGFNTKAELMHALEPLMAFRAHRHLRDYWQQMTGAQIRALSQSLYVTIGAHGYYHNDLSKIHPIEAKLEMIAVKKYLETITGRAINSIAFPYGAYHAEVIQAAKQAGYTQLLATAFNEPADAADPALRERLTINPFLSTANQCYANILGTYH